MGLQLKFVEAKLDILDKHVSVDITIHWPAPSSILDSPPIIVFDDDKEG